MTLKHRIYRLLLNLKHKTYQAFCVISVCLAAVFGLNASANAQFLRVDGTNGTCAGDGSAWGPDAYQYLQDALEFASDPFNNINQIWVRAGTYYPDQDCANPDGTGLRQSTFLLDFNNIEVLGGFNGTEIDADERDPVANLTVLSGDITNPWENCAPGTGDCFTVTLGIPGCDNMCGVDPCPGCCELVCESDPSCCVGEWDEQCVLAATQVCPGTEAPYGAYHVVTALNVDQTVRIDGFTITLGSAVGTGNDQLGAGMLILNANLAVIRVTFTENAAPIHGGGAMHIGGDSDPIVVNTSFIANTGNEAGALHTEGGPAGGTFVNCLFTKNASDVEGGAINPGGTGTLTFINCTFADNTVVSGAGGGAIATETEPVSGPVNLTNCILWNNLAGGTPKQIDDPVGVVSVTYSDVQGFLDPGWDDGFNINDDPLFVDPVNGNYRLMETSPCIDLGNNDDVPCDQFDLDNDGRACMPPDDEGTPDLDLINRVLDGDANETEIVDMGSYEFRHPDVCSCPDICPADLDGNCVVGVNDLLFLLGTWGPCADCNDCPADFDGTCDVGVNDLLFLLGTWGPCPCAPHSVVLSVEEEMENAGLTMNDWDDFEAVMTDPASSQEDKDNYYCWMDHYLNHCEPPICTEAPCPDDDPFSGHRH